VCGNCKKKCRKTEKHTPSGVPSGKPFLIRSQAGKPGNKIYIIPGGNKND